MKKTTKKTKTLTPAEYAERARTMPQAKFDAAVTKLLIEVSASAMAVQALLDARRQTAA